MLRSRTAVYIDGFNVYYRLKGSRYKWLDYRAALQAKLGPDVDLQILRYFTARVNGRFDSDAPTRQDAYLRALAAYIPEISIHEGSFVVRDRWVRMVSDPSQYAHVLIPEEKGSDVNLAVHLLNDAHRDKFDVAYVMSNDSDPEAVLGDWLDDFITVEIARETYGVAIDPATDSLNIEETQRLRGV